MTPGQERGIRELERLRASSGGCFDFQYHEEPGIASTLVAFTIRLGPMEKRPGGLDFREREDFLCLLPPDFPFDYPSLYVNHDRFAGFPHVIWSNTLCLYQSKLEWNPADGFFGFFDRMNLWLGKAAINDMDPAEGPLEPPHHVTDFSQVPFVVRANAPVEAGQRWFGLVELEKQANRMELVGWRTSMENWPEGRRMALAVVMPDTLPMEFPKKGKDIFAAFAKQGFESEQILRYLAFAALFAEDNEPGHLVVGLPMRRAADGSRRIHVAVWSIKAERIKSLRNVLGEKTDTAELAVLREEIGRALLGVFSETEISWCRVMEDRPEIVVRRDAASGLSWFLGKRVLVFGCGALGSWAAEIVTRAGAKVVDLVDNGIVKPGLLVRQNFLLTDIGANKATALMPRLQGIASPGTEIHAFSHEAHSFAFEDANRFAAYDVVIDCTASNIAQMKIERDWPRLHGQSPPVISMMTDAKAQRALCVGVPRNAAAGPWDAYIRLKYRLCTGEARSDLLDAFYDVAVAKKLFQPEPGCSDPTFSGSAADALGIAASSLNLATQHGLVPAKTFAAAFATVGTAHPIEDVPTLDGMQEFAAGNYRVRIAKKVYREARAWARQNARQRSSRHETGGLLWGLWDDATNVIWVFDASGPPRDSRHDPGHFICGTDGTSEEHKRRSAMSRGASGFVGFWHTHPEMLSKQSPVDIGGMTGLVSALGENQKHALMLIFGRTADQPTAGIYVYESHRVVHGLEFVAAGEAQGALETAVV